MPDKRKPDEQEPRPESREASPGPENATTVDQQANPFPVVGIGASAGGLEALKAFFAEVPEDSGMAYVIVVHMTPNQPSMLPELLQKASRIPVCTAQDDQALEPDNVYVIPPNKELSIYDGAIQLLPILEKGTTLPIDVFFRALAIDQGRNAAAVVLSGTGTDGTLGVKEIKTHEGLVLVQQEDSAAYDGMPRSAIATGLVDRVLPPEELPKTLIQYFRHAPGMPDDPDHAFNAENKDKSWLNKVFAILRAQVGHDFSLYKTNTLLRRIHRRMGLNQIDNHESYIRFLRENAREVEALFREFLIGVTSFFREAESFEALKKNVLPGLFEGLPDDAVFRAWIPGCSTGEEVYSLAMVLRECLDATTRRINLQLFGTDIDNFAIDRAREGVYPASIAADVNPQRLKRFFIKEGDHYRIRKEIRDVAVFSVQDIVKDPPFSRLNLLCCRNLLIYLDTRAQKKLLPLFHYTLLPDGLLVLGSSETIGGFSSLFDVVNKKWKVFKRREVPQALRQIVDFPSGMTTTETGQGIRPKDMGLPVTQFWQMTQKAILDQFAPTTLLVDTKGEILYVQGRTGKYLETPAGPPTQNVLDLAREGLRIELSTALRTARSSNQPVIRKRVAVKTNGDIQMIDLHIFPIHQPRELAGRFLVAFKDIDLPSTAGDAASGDGDGTECEASKYSELEKELQITRESHQTTIEELESSNEELKSTNEELQSSNEELQSTNEELESSKEELQSLNEELQTVNAELQSKVEELSAAHDDMRNLLNSTEIATIFVDNGKRVRRFTREATRIVNLIQTDIGRPLQHVVTNLEYADVIADLDKVLSKLSPRETEVRTQNGEWFKMRIMPYRTIDNRIDGAVLTFSSIDDQKKGQEALRTSVREMENAWYLVRTVFDMATDPVAVIDAEGKVLIANTAFSELLSLAGKDVKGFDLLGMKDGMLRDSELGQKLKNALQRNEDFNTGPVTFELADGNRSMTISGRVFKVEENIPYRILLQFTKV